MKPSGRGSARRLGGRESASGGACKSSIMLAAESHSAHLRQGACHLSNRPSRMQSSSTVLRHFKHSSRPRGVNGLPFNTDSPTTSSYVKTSTSDQQTGPAATSDQRTTHGQAAISVGYPAGARGEGRWDIDDGVYLPLSRASLRNQRITVIPS